MRTDKELVELGWELKDSGWLEKHGGACPGEDSEPCGVRRELNSLAQRDMSRIASEKDWTDLGGELTFVYHPEMFIGEEVGGVTPCSEIPAEMPGYIHFSESQLGL